LAALIPQPLPRPRFRRRGKSGFRRIGPHLQSDFEHLLPELGEQVEHRPLAPGDDLAVLGVVDGVGDSAEQRLQLLAQARHVRHPIEFGHRFHVGLGLKREFYSWSSFPGLQQPLLVYKKDSWRVGFKPRTGIQECSRLATTARQ